MFLDPLTIHNEFPVFGFLVDTHYNLTLCEIKKYIAINSSLSLSRGFADHILPQFYIVTFLSSASSPNRFLPHPDLAWHLEVCI